MSEEEKFNSMFYYDNMKYSNVTDKHIIEEVERIKTRLLELKDDIIKDGTGNIQIMSNEKTIFVSGFGDS